MTALLEACVEPFELSGSEESGPDVWVIPRLAVRSVAVLGLLAGLLLAVLHGFVGRYRRSTHE